MDLVLIFKMPLTPIKCLVKRGDNNVTQINIFCIVNNIARVRDSEQIAGMNKNLTDSSVATRPITLISYTQTDINL